MEIERVLPALIDETLLGIARMAQETVGILPGMPVDPVERCADIRPQSTDGGRVCGALPVFARKQNEQRGRVDAAIVAAERHLAQTRHLAGARLMHDLAGLRVVHRIDLRGLQGSKPRKHATRQRRHAPQQVQRRDDAVPAKCGRIPGNAGIGVVAIAVRVISIRKSASERAAMSLKASLDDVTSTDRRASRRCARAAARNARRSAPASARIRCRSRRR